MILIVDDEQHIRQFLQTILEDSGFQTVVADGRTAARTLFGQYRDTLGLLLTDIMMPDGNGLDLAAELCACKPGLKVLYVSGSHDFAAQNVHPSHYLTKPFEPRELIAKVNHLMPRVKRHAG
jgi:DNA-binding response OmpR family regulator